MQNQEGCSHAIRSGGFPELPATMMPEASVASEAAVEHIRRLGGTDSTTVGGSQTFPRDRPAHSCFGVALMSKTVTVADHDQTWLQSCLGMSIVNPQINQYLHSGANQRCT